MNLKGKATIVTGASSGIGQDVARGALFLASEEASYIHGHILVIDGGWLA
jgi:NAD(P)-dependent dehydrogenase (short-subunit alcohol dehydrogenase family)